MPMIAFYYFDPISDIESPLQNGVEWHNNRIKGLHNVFSSDNIDMICW